MLALSLLIAPASAGAVTTADPAAVRARLDEAAPLLQQRISPNAPQIPDSAWGLAAGGQVATGVAEVPGQSAKIGWGVAVIDVPIERMWAGLNDELQHRELLGLAHVEIAGGAPCADGRQVMMLLPLPLVSDRWWVAENTYNTGLAAASGGRAMELRWQSVAAPQAALSDAARAAVEGAVPVAFNEGAWLLVDLDGQRTLAEYHAWSDPGGDLPAGPASRFANATIAETVTKLADYAATNTPTCLGR